MFGVNNPSPTLVIFWLNWLALCSIYLPSLSTAPTTSNSAHNVWGAVWRKALALLLGEENCMGLSCSHHTTKTPSLACSPLPSSGLHSRKQQKMQGNQFYLLASWFLRSSTLLATKPMLASLNESSQPCSASLPTSVHAGVGESRTLGFMTAAGKGCYLPYPLLKLHVKLAFHEQDGRSPTLIPSPQVEGEEQPVLLRSPRYHAGEEGKQEDCALAMGKWLKEKALPAKAAYQALLSLLSA